MVTRSLVFAALTLSAVACWPADDVPDDPAAPAAEPADAPGELPPPINNPMGHWVEQLELPRPAGAGTYGADVDIEGDTIVIGDANSAQRVVVLNRTAGVWSVTTIFAPPGLSTPDRFGEAVSFSNDTLVVGAADFDDALLGTNAGAAWVYRRTGGVWDLGAKLTDTPGLTAGGRFGSAVAADGGTIAVGAPNSTNGEVYVYIFSGGQWLHEQTLSGMQAGARFGQRLALSGDTLVVGSPLYDDSPVNEAGRVDVFTRTNGVWGSPETIALTVPSTNDRLGVELDLNGDTLVIADEGGATDGRAHVFRFALGSWLNPEATLPLFHIMPSQKELSSLAIDGDHLVMGDRRYQSAGQVLTYERTGTNWASGDFFLSPVAPSLFTELGDKVAMHEGRFVSAVSEVAGGAAFLYAWVGERCALDSACPTEFCTDQFCCDTRCGACGQCDAAGFEGECRPQALGTSDPACGPYLCNGGDLACPTTCNNDGNCAATHHCEGQSCVPDGELGASCTSNTHCLSAQCVDGVCCDTACEDQCLACDVAGSEGTCTAVTGAPRPSKAACPADQCNEGLALSGFACDGVETTCQPAASTECAPYRCGDDACRSACEVDDDCVGGFVCRNLACVRDDTQCDGSVITEPGGDTIDCAPYRCNDADTCPRDCTTTAQCIDGYRCTALGRCVEPGEVPVTDVGCACRLSPSSSSRAGWWLLALAALARRRRQNR